MTPKHDRPQEHNMFGATLTLLRAGIAEGLRFFKMPCRWTFNV